MGKNNIYITQSGVTFVPQGIPAGVGVVPPGNVVLGLELWILVWQTIWHSFSVVQV